VGVVDGVLRGRTLARTAARRGRESTKSEGEVLGRKRGGEISAFYRAREGEERTPGEEKTVAGHGFKAIDGRE
jgi:hypothetical protein